MRRECGAPLDLLHRAIQKYLEDPLAEEILGENMKEGDVVTAGFDAEAQKIVFSIEHKTKEIEEECSSEKKAS